MRVSLILVMCGLLLLALTVPAFAQPPSLIFAFEPGGEVQTTIPLEVPAEANSTSLTLYVSQPAEATTDLQNVRLLAELTRENHLPLIGASVKFQSNVPATSTNTLDLSQNGITIPGGGRVVQVTMIISNVMATGIFSGTIVADVDGLPIKGPQLVVTHLPAPQLRIVGVNNANTLQITQDTARVQRTVYIEATNRTPTRVRVEVNHLTGQDGSQVPLSWTFGNKSSLEADVSGLTSVPLTLSADLPYSGTYTTAISLIYGDKRETVPLTVVYAPRVPQLKIAGVDNTGGMRVLQSNSQFDHTFYVEATNPVMTPVRVEVDKFVGPDGVPVLGSWELNGKTSGEDTVRGLTSLPLRIAATLPLSGTYNSAISLIYADKRETMPLVVTRVRPTPVEVMPLEIAQGEVGLFGQTPSLLLTLRETMSQKQTLYKPTFPSLYRKVNQSKYQAEIASIQIFDMDGKSPEGPLILAPGETKQIRLQLQGLDKAGEYNGLLRVSGADTQPVDQSITILLKESWFVAALFIVAGVVTSEVYRFLVKVVRPRQIQQQRILTTIQRIQSLSQDLTNLNDEEKQMLQRFVDRLRDQYDLIGQGQDQNTDPLIAEITGKLPLFSDWVNVRRRIRALTSEDLQKTYWPRADALGQKLRQPSTAEQLTKITSDVENLNADITQALHDVFKTQLDELKRQVSNQKGRASSAAAKDKFGPLEQDIGKITLPAGDDFSEAQKLYHDARRKFTVLLAEDLTEQLDAKPDGFTQPEWDSLIKPIKEQLANVITTSATDLDTAVKQYQAAYATYVKALTGKLRSVIDTALKVLEKTKIDVKIQQDALGKVKAITGLLDSAEKKADKGQGSDAAADYENAKKQLETLRQELGNIGVTMGIPEMARFASMIFGVLVPESVGENQITRIKSLQLTGVPSSRDLYVSRILVELLATVIAIVVAVFVGLNLLYVNDNTWGGPTAYIIAFLWGFALHRISDATFEGLPQLRERMAGTPGGANATH